LIEEVLLEHPAVMDVAVAPVPDSVLGEKICAFVVPRVGATQAPRLEELIAFLQGRQLAVWYQPEQLVIMQDLPRNAGAKVDKAALTRLAGTLATGTEHASGGPAHVVGSARATLNPSRGDLQNDPPTIRGSTL
jgi:non-ribosomal peptide synthetase component E (peptide arylation enzyme)